MTSQVLMPNGTPVNYDGLPDSNFRLIFSLAPMMNFFLQEFTLPGVKLNQVTRSTPFVDPNEVGEKMVYNDFNCTFLVDSNFANYNEIFSWMRRITSRGSAIDQEDNPVLIINNVESITLMGAWPTSISSLRFRANETDVVYLTCDVTFNIDYFDFTKQPLYKTNP